ncbi:MAG: amylo-alpha-1,6-glucosidase [Bryobacteraceae bacterium]
MSGQLVSFGAAICQDLEQARRREWLETNGLGGFACSTIAGLNTRRYHGLLTPALQPPGGRMLLLSKMEETLVLDGLRHDLGVNEYPGAVHPRGYRNLAAFRLDPYPVFTWRIDNVELEKRLFLVHGEDTVVIEYTLRGASSRAHLELRPLLAFRDYHSITRANDSIRRHVDSAAGVVSVRPYDGLPALHFAHHGEVTVTGDWYFYFQYAMERERGLDSEEDLFQPFVLHYDLDETHPNAVVIASTDNARRAADAPLLRDREERRRRDLTVDAVDSLDAALRLAADQFIVRRGDGYSVIAGYPWFTDWGRDTMIALPGLTLTTGRHGVARGILAAFAENIDMGMLPNRFPDAGETPEYNTADATLWYFEAIRAYLESTRDEAFVLGLFPKLRDIVEWHLRGTRYGIAATADGLLRCGVPGVQLTWMDAKIDDWVVTPRTGCPVEIQALWYNALRVAEDLSIRAGDAEFASLCRSTADNARDSFNKVFWNSGAGYLADVVEGNERDFTLRPNQIIAVSLPHSMLDPGPARSVVEAVRRQLLTPMGLRTLPERDPSYRPRYEGGVWERDSAYHQGTVWPWLIGPFVDAWLRTGGDPVFARECLDAFRDHLCDAGLGQISEIADAAAPHTPRGCFAQAWSVAEILRARHRLAAESLPEPPKAAVAKAC